MFETIIFIVGVAVGLIASALWPKGQKWGEKQAGSISKRWDDVRADYERFSIEARQEFEAIEADARERIQQLKAKYQRNRE